MKTEEKRLLTERYKDINFRYFRQRYDYASKLKYGTDVYVGQDEYCQTQNIDNTKKHHEIIIELYDQLKEFEDNVKKASQIIAKEIFNPYYTDSISIEANI